MGAVVAVVAADDAAVWLATSLVTNSRYPCSRGSFLKDFRLLRIELQCRLPCVGMAVAPHVLCTARAQLHMRRHIVFSLLVVDAACSAARLDRHERAITPATEGMPDRRSSLK